MYDEKTPSFNLNLRDRLRALGANTRTTEKFWDCRCDENYMHSKYLPQCSKCGELQENQGDSMAMEAIEQGYMTLYDAVADVLVLDEEEDEDETRACERCGTTAMPINDIPMMGYSELMCGRCYVAARRNGEIA